MKDIVCEKEVSEDTRFTTMFGDIPYYFCSRECEMEFVKNPFRYTDKSKSVSSTEGSPKMFPDGRTGSHEESSKS